MDENISTLKGIGLTMYEAQAYVTLTSLIQGSADEVSKNSGIPRSKIYDVLKKLNEKDFIEVEDGRPLTYIAKSPVEVLSREKENITSQIDDTITRLTNIYENGMSQVQAPIWRIYGVEKIINQEVEIIKRAKNTVNMRIGFLFEGEGEAIPFVKVMISDSKEMMHTYTKFSEDKRNVIPETAIGIWDKYEDVARNYDERFMNQLEKIRNKKINKKRK